MQEHASSRIADSSLPGHDASPWGDRGGKTQRHLATVSGEKCGLVPVIPEPIVDRNIEQHRALAGERVK